MSLLLIDDLGKVWQGESRQLRVAFDSPYSGGEFTEYAVKNLGFIAIDFYGSSAQLRMRPNFLGEKTVASARHWLQSAKVQRVALTTFEGGWRNELVRSHDVDARLEQSSRPIKMRSRPTFWHAPSRSPIST